MDDELMKKSHEFMDYLAQKGERFYWNSNTMRHFSDYGLLGREALKKRLEDVYIQATRLAIHAANLLLDCGDEGEEDRQNYKLLLDTITEETEHKAGVFLGADGSVCCRMFTPPFTKNRAVASAYTEHVLLPLERDLLLNLPKKYPLLEEVYVIYITYFDASLPPEKQPYFDNDNLEIKRLLDVVVCNVCVDDAAKFCQNLYLYEPAETNYSELWVVPRQGFSHWISAHSGFKFARDLKR